MSAISNALKKNTIEIWRERDKAIWLRDRKISVNSLFSRIPQCFAPWGVNRVMHLFYSFYCAVNMGKNDFCCAPGCSNSRKTRGDLHFYRIPKESNRRRVWMKRIRRKNFSPTDNTRLCSEHFVGGFKSNEIDSVSYNPSVFKHSHLKLKLSRSTKNSLRTTRESNGTPLVRRKSRKRRAETKKGRPTPEVCTLEKHEVWSQCLPADHPLKEHDYCKGQVDLQSLKVEQSIVDELLELHCIIKELEGENEKLRSKCLLLEELRLDDSKFQFWTGFPNYGTYKALFNYLEGVGALGKMRHWRGREMSSKDPSPKKAARMTKLTSEEELFMVLVRLRVGLTITDLSLRFGISESSVSKIFTSWINLLFFYLKDLCEMTESETDGKAKQFSKFPCLKVIIDCTEIFTQKPSCLQANKEIYSNYKGHTTFKFLVGIDPHGAVVYVSQAWGGRTSDKHITANSPGLTTKLNRGDELMADRGFAVHDLFADTGVKVTIPDFKGQGRSQLSKVEGKGSEKIAEARIHVERAIQRIKTFHILDNEVRLCMAHLAEQIFTVCSYLINFQSPILQQ